VGYFKENLMARQSRFACTALALCLLCTGWLASPLAYAQKASDQTPTPVIAGTTLDKKQFQLKSLKGKVVLVMFWSTDCAVCRDKMTELRQNVQGWADKPFELVLVSLDRRMEDVEGYNAIINKAVPMKQRFTQLWVGDKSYQDNLGASQLQRAQLPTTLLIDKSGKLLERYNGRIPAEVWDTISDLL
jgi:cytochrome oxidase Cu insertion factor (SCO1/SenC/PrrC family)